MKTTQKAHEFIWDKLPTIAGYNAQGYGVFVYADTHGNIGLTPFTNSTVWNYECNDQLLYIFPAFEGGAPDMVNDHWDLLDGEEQEAADKSGMNAAEYLESIGSSINERQIECWVEETRYEIDSFRAKYACDLCGREIASGDGNLCFSCNHDVRNDR